VQFELYQKLAIYLVHVFGTSFWQTVPETTSFWYQKHETVSPL